MSKTQVKKLLEHLDAEQMKEMILDLYDARPEAKDYLDFYAQPDIDARLEKARSLIDKEVKRTHRGYPRPRVTKLRRFIKDITSLNPGMEFSLDIMTYTFERLCSRAGSMYKEATQKSTAKLLQEIIATADRNGMLNEYLTRVSAAIEAIPKRYSAFVPNRMRALLKETLETSLSGI